MLVDNPPDRWNPAEGSEAWSSPLEALLQSDFPNTRIANGDSQAIAEQADNADLVLFATRNASPDSPRIALGRVLIAGSTPLVHLVLRAPYGAELLPEAGGIVLTYGDPLSSLEGLVEVLAGKRAATGILPISWTMANTSGQRI